MTRLTLSVVTLAGTDYLLFRTPKGGWNFPTGEFVEGESPAVAARRLVREWTGTSEPKLELLDFRAEAAGGLRFVFRALLTADPTPTVETGRFKRMEIPSLDGPITPREVEEMQKTGLSYKLTRG